MKITINDSLGFNLFQHFTPEIVNRSALCRIMGFDDNRFHRHEKKNGFERALKHFIAEARKAKAE
ncbi:hypothetical protein [Serratia marcescens]|uniref:hypothetical protein n=1 Tax=Serratia TaxID=613 RepID=UPI0011B9C0E8|nr:hypothetical protein [Serratia marcescens]MDF8316508.1 hypothetical protein [Serratia nevei]TWY30537.1 hypothetical protein FR992_24865 [Serratia marcescens]TYR75179.1 hypothetical protein FYK38_26145 [Serratia marcescens]